MWQNRENLKNKPKLQFCCTRHCKKSVLLSDLLKRIILDSAGNPWLMCGVWCSEVLDYQCLDIYASSYTSPSMCLQTLKDKQYTAVVVHLWFWHSWNSIMHNDGIIYSIHTHKDVNMNPKLSSKWCKDWIFVSEMQEKLEIKKPELSKIIHYVCGGLAKTAKKNRKCRKILNRETLNPDSAVNSALCTSKACYLQ